MKRWPDAFKLPRASEVLLSPGEILILPESWWMQCYFDEPTWAISSQYLNMKNLDRVLLNVLQHNHIEAETIFALDSMPPEQRIDAVLSSVLGSKGHGNGRALLAWLRQRDATCQHDILADEGNGEK